MKSRWWKGFVNGDMGLGYLEEDLGSVGGVVNLGEEDPGGD